MAEQHETLAMFGADRLSVGLQVLRDRPGYSTGVFQTEHRSSKSERAAVDYVARVESMARSRAAWARKRRLQERQRGLLMREYVEAYDRRSANAALAVVSRSISLAAK